MIEEKKLQQVRLRHATDAQIYQELNRRSRIEITKQVLLVIAAGSVLVAGAITAPNLTAFICKQIYKRTRNRQYLKRDPPFKSRLVDFVSKSLSQPKYSN